MIDVITKYFDLTERQIEQFRALDALYREWNARINVISRKDIDSLYINHILHSLAIAKVCTFAPGARILDIGCGGGFPGIPLAIMFPDVQFHLVDSIGKKVRVAGEIAAAIGLENVRISHSRAEEIKEKYSFVVSRAVMQLPDLVKICRKNISKEQNNVLPNGIICLKGGDMTAETQPFRNSCEVVNVSNYFDEEYFKDKKVVYVQI